MPLNYEGTSLSPKYRKSVLVLGLHVVTINRIDGRFSLDREHVVARGPNRMDTDALQGLGTCCCAAWQPVRDSCALSDVQ